MIDISVGPNLFTIQNGINLALAWHGIFSLLGVITAVYLVARWGPMKGFISDEILSMAIWCVLGGFIGARIVHVIDHWAFYSDNLARIFFIWQGGIGVWGGILGGLLGGISYVAIMRVPVAKWGVLMDMTAPALLLAQTIGRLGDIANGEHCAKAASHFLSFTWSHPQTLASNCAAGFVTGAEPVILYEIVGNCIILAIIWSLRDRLKPAGMLWAVYLSLYSLARFGISFAREDRIWAWGMQEAHYIALLVLIITIPLLVYKARWVPREAIPQNIPVVSMFRSNTKSTRAQRRRKSD